MRRNLLTFAIVLCSLPVVLAGPVSAATTLSPHLSYIKPQDIDGTIGFGLNSDLYQFTDVIHLEANGDYWGKSVGGVDFRDIALGGTVKYYLGQPGASAQPFLAGGLGLHFFHGGADIPIYDDTFQIIGTESVSSNDTKLGLDLGGGVLFGSSPTTKFLGELRYRVVSDVSQLCLTAGMVFNFD